MNKESIYKIIGYNGEYNASVKKAIRKLLKENHPDKNGDAKIFALINEVKEELENNKVTYNYKHDKKSDIKDDIDYSYCCEMIEKITKEKNIYTNTLKKKNEKLAKYGVEYKDYYHKSIDFEAYLLNNSKYMNQLKKTKTICIYMLILCLIIFVISIWKKSIICFAIFTLLSIICILIIQKSFYIMQEMTENNRNKVKKYVGVNNRLRNTQESQEKLRKEVFELEKKITNLDNDLRFYNNLLKK